MIPRTLLPLACLFGLSVMAQELHVVRPLDIRPVGEDYAPVFLDSGFVMVSVREAQGLVDYTDARTGKPLSDLYWVPLKNGKAGHPVLFSNVLTTPVNEGPASFAQNGALVCYTRNLVLPRDPTRIRHSESQLGLFFSTRNEGIWSTPVPFEHNSDRYSMVHPTLSPSGDTLLFASDMPGGMGGMDLYISVRTTAGWSKPAGLGPMVNSAHHEAYPRLLRDGRLRFATDRPGGHGGMDILEAETGASGWKPAAQLPAPINGPGNDLVLEPLGDDQHALLSSDREGSDAIFLVKRTVPHFRDCIPQQQNNYCYAVRTENPAITHDLPLDHVWDMGDGTLIKGLQAQHCFKKPGTYTISSMLVDRHTGNVFHVLREHELHIADHEQAFIASPDTLRTGRQLALDALRSHIPGMVADEYHWDLGDGERKSGARITHLYRTPGTYEVRLDVIGKPNADGSIPNRCNTKLITVIDRYREDEDMTVTAVYQDALGRTHTFVYQDLPFDDLSIDPVEEADAKLSIRLFASKERISLDDPRFTQLRKLHTVLEQFDPMTGLYVYSVGVTDDTEELMALYKKVRDLQFLDAEVLVIHEEAVLDLSTLSSKRTADLDRKKIRLESILFAFRSAELDASALPVLDELAELLSRHPDLHLVIEAHTDDVGSRAYNLDLSQRRAASVAEHLISKGFSPERISAIGHGKNQPVADNRTDEGRRLNRRVEFRMMLGGQEQVYEPRR